MERAGSAHNFYEAFYNTKFYHWSGRKSSWQLLSFIEIIRYHQGVPMVYNCNYMYINLHMKHAPHTEHVRTRYNFYGIYEFQNKTLSTCS